MQIMTILGSPRRQGNTAKVLGWIEEQFHAAGHEVDAANILDYHVQGCGECLACKKGAVELCSIDDDANALFRRMAAADLVLIAAPVFCWGISGPDQGPDRPDVLHDGLRRRAPRRPSAPWQADGPLAHRRR